MDIIFIAQVIATLLLCTVLCLIATLLFGKIRLKRLFSDEYIRVIQTRNIRQLYPLVPKPSSIKYSRTKRFLTSVGWHVSVESIYLCKWGLFAVTLFVLVTIYTTNATLEFKRIVQDVNYNHSMIETLNVSSQENINLEKELFHLIDNSLVTGDDFYNKLNKEIYIGYIENLISQKGYDTGNDLRETAQRLYYKVLITRSIRNGISPYIYIILFSSLIYYIPDILGQIKKKLIEDKKNWEILNCMIVFSIFGRMPPFSVMTILEHMAIVTDVYKPIIEGLIEGLKKGGRQEETFDTALEAVDRDELYELFETLKLARKTGLVNAVDDVDAAIDNTIKWIEIENISRRRIKMLYAMSAVAVVMGLGCIYFSYGLTVISNPANMIIK